MRHRVVVKQWTLECVLATITASELVVAVIAKGAAFTEVEAFRPFVRVRGFVDNAAMIGTPTRSTFAAPGPVTGSGCRTRSASVHRP